MIEVKICMSYNDQRQMLQHAATSSKVSDTTRLAWIRVWFVQCLVALDIMSDCESMEELVVICWAALYNDVYEQNATRATPQT